MCYNKKAMSEQNKQKWYQLDTEDVLERLGSRLEGLSSAEVEERRQVHGFNMLPEQPPVPLIKLLANQVKSPLVYILLVAAAISLFVGEMVDVIVILAAVILNTVIGLWQEYKADRAIHRLRALVQHQVTVLRDGREQRILAKQLVPGDILLFEAGDKISADGRILEEKNLKMNEASLTGESFPVDKSVNSLPSEHSVGDRANMVHTGTTVASGRGMAIVTKTGLNTEIGQIASLVKDTIDEKTPLQIQLLNVSKLLTITVLIAAGIVFLIELFSGLELAEILVTTAALAVAAIPESLLVAMTLVLVVGMQRILKRRALVRKLIAAETLGSVSIVCSDKTGTITEGKMAVDQLLVGGKLHDMKAGHGHLSAEDEAHHLLAIKTMALCNNAYIKNPEDKLKEWEIIGDSTDVALLIAAEQAGFEKEKLLQVYRRVGEVPFDEVYKFQATLYEKPEGGSQLFVKGAPENVLSMCNRFLRAGRRFSIDERRRKELLEEYESMTRKGLRVLALATSEYQKKTAVRMEDLLAESNPPAFDDLVFIGWVGLKDPVRSDAAEAFQTMRGAGIRTVIITGDHKYTVQAIVRELGMTVPDERILTGRAIETMSDDELEARVQSIDIFARVEPKHKLRIVQAWRKQGEVVAMLGDGVNDAPALKAADIGIAVGDATDVAKETSDMILLNGNFSVIEAAIREGRVMFDNIRKIFLYLMSDSFTEIILITLALLLGYPLPLVAVQILWINLISDGLPNLALTLEPAERDVMSYPPRRKEERIVNKEILFMIGLITAMAVTAALSLFILYLAKTGDLLYARTMVFCMFAVDSIIYVFSIKTLRQPIWKSNLLSNKLLLAAVGFSLSAQIFFVQTPVLGNFLKTIPLRWEDWALIFAIGLTELMVREIVKWLYWHNRTRRAQFA